MGLGLEGGPPAREARPRDRLKRKVTRKGGWKGERGSFSTEW
jgi:hypothetical protein